MYSIPIRVSKCEVHVTSEVKKYVISVVYKNKLTKSNSVSKLTLVVISCNKDIPNKFKTVKFIPE